MIGTPKGSSIDRESEGLKFPNRCSVSTFSAGYGEERREWIIRGHSESNEIRAGGQRIDNDGHIPLFSTKTLSKSQG